ncbi:MAG TPA: hypothetical protein VI544_01000, partial [Candidatus Nanoarchaeia archaeon]|nr:hypothetical protein [Candidatus Nanoarchaeia archaeon]
MVKEITSADRLVEELFSESCEHGRCPYIRKDSEGPYCAKNLGDGLIVSGRRLATDIVSLQLWCLTKESYQH